MSKSMSFQQGFHDYPSNLNPHKGGTPEWWDYDRGFWFAHDESYVEDSSGIEDGYGDFYEAEACRWDDDPSPYNGDYSEM